MPLCRELARKTIREQKANGFGLFTCDNCSSQNIHYSLWRRKTQGKGFQSSNYMLKWL